MEYFIDQSALHQYSQHLERLRVEYQLTSVDYHVRVITALLSCRCACKFPDPPFRHANVMFPNLTLVALFPREYQPIHRPVQLDIWHTFIDGQYYTTNYACSQHTSMIEGCQQPIPRALIFRVLLTLMLKAYYIVFDVPYSVRKAIDVNVLIQDFEWDSEVTTGETRTGQRAELAKVVGVVFR
jgi:hypothetical protein